MELQKPLSSIAPPVDAGTNETSDLPDDYHTFLRDIKAQVQSAQEADAAN